MKYEVKRIPTTNRWGLYKNGCHLKEYSSECSAMITLCMQNKDWEGARDWQVIFHQKRVLRREIAAIEKERGYGDGWYEIGI